MDLSHVCVCVFMYILGCIEHAFGTYVADIPYTKSVYIKYRHNGAHRVWPYYNYYYLFMTTCQSVTSSERVRGYAAFVFQ